MKPATAKIFATGGSQAVRLPAEFRFEGQTQVYIRRNLITGDVVLSIKPSTPWTDFMRVREKADQAELAGFMLDREQPPVQKRDPFAGEFA